MFRQVFMCHPVPEMRVLYCRFVLNLPGVWQAVSWRNSHEEKSIIRFVVNPDGFPFNSQFSYFEGNKDALPVSHERTGWISA